MNVEAASSCTHHITQRTHREKFGGEGKDTRPNQTKELATRAVLKIKRASQVDTSTDRNPFPVVIHSVFTLHQPLL